MARSITILFLVSICLLLLNACRGVKPLDFSAKQIRKQTFVLVESNQCQSSGINRYNYFYNKTTQKLEKLPEEGSYYYDQNGRLIAFENKNKFDRYVYIKGHPYSVKQGLKYQKEKSLDFTGDSVDAVFKQLNQHHFRADTREYFIFQNFTKQYALGSTIKSNTKHLVVIESEDHILSQKKLDSIYLNQDNVQRYVSRRGPNNEIIELKEFDKKGRLITEIFTADPKGRNLKEHNQFIYDHNNQLIRKIAYLDPKDDTILQRDSVKRIWETELSYENGLLTSSIITQYSTHIPSNYKKEKVDKSNYYEYDDAGKLTQSIEQARSYSKAVKSYTYNQQGDVVKYILHYNYGTDTIQKIINLNYNYQGATGKEYEVEIQSDSCVLKMQVSERLSPGR